MHHRHHNHHNDRIKIVPFNQSDNDQTIPNNLYHFIHVHKLPVWKNLGHLWNYQLNCKCFLSSEHVFFGTI